MAVVSILSVLSQCLVVLLSFHNTQPGTMSSLIPACKASALRNTLRFTHGLQRERAASSALAVGIGIRFLATVDIQSGNGDNPTDVTPLGARQWRACLFA
jgi:hypothetical protein